MKGELVFNKGTSGTEHTLCKQVFWVPIPTQPPASSGAVGHALKLRLSVHIRKMGIAAHLTGPLSGLDEFNIENTHKSAWTLNKSWTLLVLTIISVKHGGKDL